MPGIIWLASYPKSGNTWLRAFLANYMQNPEQPLPINDLPNHILGDSGVPHYERFSGKKVDGRSDLFSLGVLLYQMTSGGLPFKGDSMATLMFKIANEEHPDVREIRADLPDGVKVIIDKALKKDAEERYQNGDDMARDLRQCMAGLPD